jgi:3-dehydroquinate dehydratase / shikimate dehydrogenase
VNNGKICVPVCAETPDEVIAAVQRAREIADLIELRFDCTAEKDVGRVIKSLPDANYIFTFRPASQGGKRELTLSERLKFWELVLNEPPAGLMIDIEGEPNVAVAVPANDVPRILSYHDFGPTPPDLGSMFDGLAGFAPDVVKIAITADDIVDAIGAWNLLKKAVVANIGVIPIAMGEAGKWTRILGLAHGAYVTYGSLDEGKETADGQITARDMIDVYRVKELDRYTRVFGIIGDPVSSSLSPFIHNPAFRDTGENAVFIPLLVKDLDAFIRRMVKRATREVELNFGGFSVTMPHKQAIMKHLDDIDDTAKKIGAVNTVKIDRDRLIGYNTDAHGFVEPLKARLGDLRDTRAWIVGTGGAARACIHALHEAGADVAVFGREPARSHALAEEFGVRAGSISGLRSEITGADILINATPLGMRGANEDETIATATELGRVKLVYDLVYNPSETRLLGEAKEAGVPTIGGLEMLIAQGARQCEIWTGREAPVELMRKAVTERLKRWVSRR